jgi:hypothetical protein
MPLVLLPRVPHHANQARKPLVVAVSSTRSSSPSTTRQQSRATLAWTRLSGTTLPSLCSSQTQALIVPGLVVSSLLLLRCIRRQRPFPAPFVSRCSRSHVTHQSPSVPRHPQPLSIPKPLHLGKSAVRFPRQPVAATELDADLSPPLWTRHNRLRTLPTWLHPMQYAVDGATVDRKAEVISKAHGGS